MTRAHNFHSVADDDRGPLVLERHHGDEVSLRNIPSPELALRRRAASEARMLFDQMPQQLAVAQVGQWRKLDHRRVALLLQLAELVEHERHPATHPRGKIPPRATENDDGAAGHVLAAVIADSLHHRNRSTVAHSEALAGNSRKIRF